MALVDESNLLAMRARAAKFRTNTLEQSRTSASCGSWRRFRLFHLPGPMLIQIMFARYPAVLLQVSFVTCVCCANAKNPGPMVVIMPQKTRLVVPNLT